MEKTVSIHVHACHWPCLQSLRISAFTSVPWQHEAHPGHIQVHTQLLSTVAACAVCELAASLGEVRMMARQSGNPRRSKSAKIHWGQPFHCIRKACTHMQAKHVHALHVDPELVNCCKRHWQTVHLTRMTTSLTISNIHDTCSAPAQGQCPASCHNACMQLCGNEWHLLTWKTPIDHQCALHYEYIG